MWLLCLAGFLISVWAAFFGGAEKLEGTFLGYFEFGHFADKASYIRAVSLISMALFAFGLFYEAAA
jgi:hypothetical protein